MKLGKCALQQFTIVLISLHVEVGKIILLESNWVGENKMNIQIKKIQVASCV